MTSIEHGRTANLIRRNLLLAYLIGMPFAVAVGASLAVMVKLTGE